MSSNPNTTRAQSSDDSVQDRRTGFTLVELIVVICIIGILIALLLPARRSAGPAARRMQCANNLKQIALALHNYESVYQALPPAYTLNDEGQPLHSWRTLILPFLEEQSLYDSIDQSRPWDHPANATARESIPSAFRCPSVDIPPTFTTYMGIVATTGCFHPTEVRTFSEITDSPSNTLMVIEVSPDDAVHWMAPRDTDDRFVLGFGPDTKLAHEGGTQAAFVDGSVDFIVDERSNAERRAMITIAGSDGPDAEVVNGADR